MCLNIRFEYGNVGIKYVCFETEFKFRDEKLSEGCGINIAIS